MGIDVPKQLKYWRDSAKSDLETAEILIDKGKYLEGLFFCHLAIEKALKSRVVKATRNLPPRTHNLLRLAEVAGISLEKDRAELFGEMMLFHLEGRYPDIYRKPPDKEKCREYLRAARENVKWLVETS